MKPILLTGLVAIALTTVGVAARSAQQAGAPARPAFEAATIKLAAPDAIANRVLSPAPNRLSIPSMRLTALIYAAYGDGGFNTSMSVRGGPDWANRTAFAVEGVATGKVTPLHLHPDSDETMIVLDGQILMHMDGTDHRIGVGGVAIAPRGVPHAFLVMTATARLLCLHTPGCCQAFYWDASEPLDVDNPVPRRVDFGLVHASAARNGGIEILGPPPFSQEP